MSPVLTRWVHAQWQKKGCVARLLYPLSLITARIVRQRQKHRVKPAPSVFPPIIIVGNILVGGAGKTPVVIALCKALKAQGFCPGVISRGYGVKIGPTAQSGRPPLDPALVGDEPSLIAAEAQVPIGVHPDRLLAVQALLELAPETDVIIADDGLQHYALPRDLEIIVQDERGVGNGWLLPAGPLREEPQRLQTVDWVIQHGPAPNAQAAVYMRLSPTVFEHLATGQRIPVAQWLATHDTDCQAYAAIGQPQRFFNQLSALGIRLNQTIALADHASLDSADLQRFHDGPILTTTKDGIKLAYGPLRSDPRFWLLHVEAVFDPADWLTTLVRQIKRFQPGNERVKNKK